MSSAYQRRFGGVNKYFISEIFHNLGGVALGFIRQFT